MRLIFVAFLFGFSPPSVGLTREAEFYSRFAPDSSPLRRIDAIQPGHRRSLEPALLPLGSARARPVFVTETLECGRLFQIPRNGRACTFAKARPGMTLAAWQGNASRPAATSFAHARLGIARVIIGRDEDDLHTRVQRVEESANGVIVLRAAVCWPRFAGMAWVTRANTHIADSTGGTDGSAIRRQIRHASARLHGQIVALAS